MLFPEIKKNEDPTKATRKPTLTFCETWSQNRKISKWWLCKSL